MTQIMTSLIDMLLRRLSELIGSNESVRERLLAVSRHGGLLVLVLACIYTIFPPNAQRRITQDRKRNDILFLLEGNLLVEHNYLCIVQF